MNKALRIILIALAVIVGLLAVFAVGFFIVNGLSGGFFEHRIMIEGNRAFANPDGRFLGPRMMAGYSPFGFLGGILARLVGLGLFVALIVLLVWAASRLFAPRNAYQSPGKPVESLNVQEILDRRYARGEIGREEYLQVLKDTGHPAPDMPEPPDAPQAG